jgi:cell filamentation protein
LGIQLGFGPQAPLDSNHLKAIHHCIFKDVFEWAGHTRDEPVLLSDGSVASQLSFHKPNGTNFLSGLHIPRELNNFDSKLAEADYLRNLSREAFCQKAADLMCELNSIHPFREGNGRTQRIFMEQLARQAGHTLDFSVVSSERMIQASVAAHEDTDHSIMRRMFDEISNPARVDLLRVTIGDLERQKFEWNDRYIATLEPGRSIQLLMVGVRGNQFMARTDTEILIGQTSDLPTPRPNARESFQFVASDYKEVVVREQREESDKRQSPAIEGAARSERERSSDHHPHATGETKSEKPYQKRYAPTNDREQNERSHGHDRGGRGGRRR